MALTRSENMSRIRGKNTKPEVYLRKAVWARGLRYRLHAKAPAGRPDLVFPKHKVAVFIDGCFWHGCPDHYVRPRSRTEFWSAKLSENTGRDQRQTIKLEDAGWTVLRFWEHQVFEELDTITDTVEAVIRGKTQKLPAHWRVIRVVPMDAEGTQEKRFLNALRLPDSSKIVEQARHTRKWKRPS